MANLYLLAVPARGASILAPDLINRREEGTGRISPTRLVALLSPTIAAKTSSPPESSAAARRPRRRPKASVLPEDFVVAEYLVVAEQFVAIERLAAVEHLVAAEHLVAVEHLVATRGLRIRSRPSSPSAQRSRRTLLRTSPAISTRLASAI